MGVGSSGIIKSVLGTAKKRVVNDIVASYQPIKISVCAPFLGGVRQRGINYTLSVLLSVPA